MQLKSATIEILAKLRNLCKQLKPEEYAKPLELLINNSIGKHIRHIIEFFNCLRESALSGEVNYDKRKHSKDLEENVEMALSMLDDIEHWVNQIPDNQELNMWFSYDNTTGKEMCVDTNLKRELAYNIEHAVHHMAIIKIALEKEFKNVIIDKNFGIAHSTIRHNYGLCAR